VDHAPFSGIGLKVTGLQKVVAYGAPSDADLELINKFALKPLTAKDVSVYTLQVCNDQIDRDDERFSLEVLGDFSATLPGKGLLEGHQWGPVGVGLFYKSWVENIGGVNWVIGQCYLPKASEESAEMIVKLDAGIAKWVSIGFYAPCRMPIYGNTTDEVDDKASQSGGPVYPSVIGQPSFDMDSIGREYECIEYQRGPDGEKGESLECSLVFLGSQYDAAVVKSMTSRLEDAVAKDGRVLNGKNLAKLKAARDAVHDVITMHETHHGDGSAPQMEEKLVNRIVDAVVSRVTRMFTGSGTSPASDGTTTPTESAKEITAMDVKEIKAAVEAQVKAAFEALGFDVEDVKSAIASVKSITVEITGLKKSFAQFGEKLSAQTEAADALAERIGAVEGSVNDSETKDKDGKAVKVEGLASSMKALIAAQADTEKAFDDVDGHLTNIYATLGVAVGEGDAVGTEEPVKGADGKPQPVDSYKDKGARPASGGKTTASIFGDSLTPEQYTRKSA